MKYADRPSSTTTTTSDLPLFPLSSLLSIHPLPLFSSHFFPTPRVVTRVLSRWGRGEIAAEDRLLVSSLHLSSFFFFLSPQDFQFSPPLRTPRFFDLTRARIFSFGITRASSSSCSSKKIYKIVRSVFWSVSRDLEGAPSSFRPPIEARADHRQPSAVTNGDVRR